MSLCGAHIAVVRPKPAYFMFFLFFSFSADHAGHFLCLPRDRLCHLQEENVTPFSRYVCLLQMDGGLLSLIPHHYI